MAWALLPVGLSYALLDAGVRALTSVKRAPLPVICVGNLTAGGAGKTPMTLALAALMLEKKVQPAILSRGYGRHETAPMRVDPDHHSPREVGDEPLLLAQLCPTYVGANRLVTAALAAADGAQVLLLDDGLQHHRLHKDLALEVRRAEIGLGNRWPLPAGPLRQWFGLGQRSVDRTLIIGKDANPLAALPAGFSLQRPVAAFCGLADPEKFRATLAKLGLKPAWFHGYPDHHRFTDVDLAQLLDLSTAHTLLTTEKDWVRLPAPLQERTQVVAYQIQLTHPEKLWQDIRPYLQGRSSL